MITNMPYMRSFYNKREDTTNAYSRFRYFVDKYPPPLIDSAQESYLKMLLIALERNIHLKSCSWDVLARYWLIYFTDTQLDKAEKCARRYEMEAGDSSILIASAARCWNGLAKFDPSYKADARRCLLAAETLRADTSDLTACAECWHSVFGMEDCEKIVGLLKKAESRLEKPWEIETIALSWARIFGMHNSRAEVREFLLRTSKKSWAKNEMNIAKSWLNIVNDGNTYSLCLESQADIKRAKQSDTPDDCDGLFDL